MTNKPLNHTHHFALVIFPLQMPLFQLLQSQTLHHTQCKLCVPFYEKKYVIHKERTEEKLGC